MSSASTVIALLLDIEGTTTPLDFVHRILFPYARAHMEAYLAMYWDTPAVQEDLALLKQEYSREEENLKSSLPDWQATAQADSALRYLNWLMDRDRKSRALKFLQGKIWQLGYEAGEIIGQVYDDVPPFLEEWQARGGHTYIFSSGSVLAQQLLFRHSNHGDLTRLLNGYFDTGVGSKREPASYEFIARMVGIAAPKLLFVSDVAEELSAADAAGLRVALSVRPGNLPVMGAHYTTITDFRQLQALMQTGD